MSDDTTPHDPLPRPDATAPDGAAADPTSPDASASRPAPPPDASASGPAPPPDAPAPRDDHTVAPASLMGGRLHPSVIAVWSLRSLAPLIAVWIASEAIGRSLGLVALALILGGSWVRWLRFEWTIEADQVVIEQGLLQRTRRVIPIARIQAVQTVRKLQHRVFGVVGLRIEAIGGSDTEGQLDALDTDTARQVQLTLMRRSDVGSPATGEGARAGAAADGTTRAMPPDGAVTPSDATHLPPARRAATSSDADTTPPGPGAPPHSSWDQRPTIPATDVLAADTPAGTVVARCPPRMLVVAGLTGGRVGVAAAIIGLAQQTFGERLTDAALSAPERLGLTTALVVLVVAVVAVFLLSVAATALTYWDFTVLRDGRLLRLHRGLLDERRDTVPLARVQSVTVEQNILRRGLGLVAVKMVVAGRAGDDSDLTSTLLPIAHRADALRLLDDLFDVGDIDRITLTPMPLAARRRRVTRAVVAALVVGGASWAFADAYAIAAALVVAAVGIPMAIGSYRSLGWAHDGDVVLGRSGWLVRRLTVTSARALQSAQLSSSPFQRRVDLATLHLEIARTRGGRDPRLLDLAADDGSALLATLAAAQPRDTASAGASPAPT